MTSRQGRRALQLLAGLALSGLFLWLALRGEDWGAIRREMAAADYRYLALLLPLGAYGLYARAQRWRILLEKTHNRSIPMMPVYSASAIGFMANMVLPFRVGEVARPLLVARSVGLPPASTFATVVVERVLDLLTLALFGVVIVSSTEVPAVVERLALAAGVIAVTLFFGAWVVVMQRARILPLLDRVWGRIPGVGPHLLRLEHEFVDGMSAIADPVTLIRTILWSIYIWLVIALSFSVAFPAVGLDVPFFGAGITVTTIVALAVSVPSAPAFVGQFEWGCKLALEQIHGVSGSAAIGYSILVHATQFVTQILLGVVFLAREGLSLRDLRRMDEQAQVLDTLEATEPAAIVEPAERET